MFTKKLILFLGLIITLTSCHQSSRTEVDAAMADTTVTPAQSPKDFSLYGKVDSTFVIRDKKFRLVVKQYDVTEEAAAKGDTLSRPTYMCTVTITDSTGKNIFADSVLRDSWGYPGKIVSIDAYQIALPQLRYEANEIILAFNIFEQIDGDAIEGLIAFDVNTAKAHYYFQEAEMQ